MFSIHICLFLSVCPLLVLKSACYELIHVKAAAVQTTLFAVRKCMTHHHIEKYFFFLKETMDLNKVRLIFARNDCNRINFFLFYKSDKMVLSFALGNVLRTKIQFAQKLQCETSVVWNQASSKSVKYLQKKKAYLRKEQCP